jgi:hypothetical protein
MVQANAKSTTRSRKPRKPRKSKADTLIAEAIAAIQAIANEINASR